MNLSLLPLRGILLLNLVALASVQADLIALYKFDETSGDTASDSVSANDASWVPLLGSTPDWKPGIIGGSNDFPGSGSHVNYFSIPSFPELNGTPAGMTIATWFKPDGASGYRGILTSRGITETQVYGLAHESDHLDGRVDNAAVDSAGGTVPANGEWFHVAWVWDNVGKTQQLFINGSSATSESSVSLQSFSSNEDWRIGDDSCCNNRNLNGSLDDLAIYDEPLSPAEIAALYSKGLNGYSADEEPPPPVTDPLNVGLVINEIHSDASPKTDFVEFVELLNTGPDPIDISGYRFDGIDFTFPAGTVIGVTEYVVVGENPAETYQYSGTLSGEGERLTLFDAAGLVVDRVDYTREFPWPIVDDGTSLQLINATLDNDLGGAWRPALPTPGLPNLAFATNAPPLMRQVSHSPKQPTSGDAITVSVKATDPDGIGSLTLHYQTNAPGSFVPAFLPLPTSQLNSSPATPLSANPDFEQNWVDLTMVADASGEIFSVDIPAQAHRTLVRYRITAADSLGNRIRAPFPEDPSLNFATFSYDGVPDYTTDGGTIYPSEVLTALPVYHLITDPDDLAQCWAYDSADRACGVAARKKFNWEGAMVYDGVTYDHIGFRLRQRNDRYIGQGRRGMRFRFRRGNYFQARDPEGQKYPVKWRSMNTSKMSRFVEGANHGMRELVSSRLWNLAGVTAPEFQHIHFRVVDDAVEQSDQYHGDFYGLSMIFEDADGQFLEGRNLPKGNVYKLKDGEVNPLELQKYQARGAVADGSDFVNIRDNLGPPTQSDSWLRDHVDWDAWYLYAALGEGFRHYDFAPYHQKNRIWYFKPDPTTPFGLMSIIPHDTDATWKRGTNDGQWDDPRYGPGPSTQRGRVVGIDLPKEAIQEITGLDETDGENHPEREAFMLEYRNVIREVRDLFWQPETVLTVIDEAYQNIAAFSPADVARWSGGPPDAGNENIGPLEPQVDIIRSLAFTEDLYLGSSLAGGRAQWLSNLAVDAEIPNKPTISYGGTAGFPAGGIVLNSSPFADPQGAGTFGKIEWRVAEVTPPASSSIELLAAGSSWAYLDDGSDQGVAWRAANFDDSAWQTIGSPAGYGSITNTTLVAPEIDFGPDLGNKYVTTYFRTTVEVLDATAIGSLTFALNVDDGAVVYINGDEVLRDGIDEDTLIGFDVLADSNGNEGVFDEFLVPAGSLVTGTNVIAVEVHQRARNSSDLCFDLSLEANPITPDILHEWHAAWESGELLTPTLSIAPPAVATRAGSYYRARVRHQDDTGRWSHWSEPLEFQASQADVSLYADSLVISEIMYHPTDPNAAEIAAGFDDDDFFEYIEIRNVGDQVIDLSDVRFTKGVDIDLIGSIAPGAYVLVVDNIAAFEMRYGAGMPVIGEWSGKLDNGGEQLKLSFGAGEPIRDFVYNDTAPWPTSPDGDGDSLVLIDPFDVPDHASPFSWRSGIATPNDSDGTVFTGGDLLAYAVGAGGVGVSAASGGGIHLNIELNQLAEDVIGRWEYSTDLTSWSPVTDLVQTAVTTGADGFSMSTFSAGAGFLQERCFFRYSVSLR